MKNYDAVVILSGTAHVLTWLVAIFLMVAPVYQGESVTAVVGESGQGESTLSSASLIAVNGLKELPIVFATVVLSGLGLYGALTTHARKTRRLSVLWVSAFLLLALSVIGIASIGLFILPAALLLIASSVVALKRPPLRQ